MMPHSKKAWYVLAGGLLILLLFITVLLPSGKARSSDTDMLVIGHAGSGFLSPLNPFNPLPANSMASIIKAMEEHGADGVEVDVQLTQDGVFVLYHDVKLNSMTDETGLIEDHKAADVVGLKYKGGFFYDLFHGEEIITLEQMLQHFATYPELPYLYLDLRNHDPARHLYYAQTLMTLLKKYNYPLAKLVFVSPNADFLEAFRQIEPKAVLMPDAGTEFESTLVVALAHNFQGICVNGKSVSQEQVQRAKAEGLQVVLFGGKSHSTIKKMVALEPHAILVNNVKEMRKVLE